MSNEPYSSLRKEYSSHNFRAYMKSRLGNECINCGSDIGIEYHHVVPLALGGTNNIANIVPLCHECHQKAHGSVNIRSIFRAENTGRKKLSPPKNYKDILHDYYHGKIGLKQCKQLLGIGKSTHLQEVDYVNEYRNEMGIVKCKNYIDNPSYCKKYIACVEYSDGRIFIARK